MAHHKLNKISRYAQIAQLVEQGTENPRVLGSIPSLGTTYVKNNGLIISTVVFLHLLLFYRNSFFPCHVFLWRISLCMVLRIVRFR